MICNADYFVLASVRNDEGRGLGTRGEIGVVTVPACLVSMCGLCRRDFVMSCCYSMRKMLWISVIQ